ncbi:hypothetical protein D3C78_1548140 [compost metagenome]
MQVERAFAGGGQQGFAQQVAVIEGEQVIGVELGDALDPQRVVGVFRCIHRDALAGTQLRDRTVEGVLLRVVGVSEHRGNLQARVEEGLDARTADVVIGENNSF